MAGEVKAALSPEEWAALESGGVRGGDRFIAMPDGSFRDLDGASSMAVDNCFAGPDGGPLFTWKDVGLLRQAADDAEAEARPYPSGCAEARAPYDDLADRLATLLPPRETP